jgi:hypothetical protein
MDAHFGSGAAGDLRHTNAALLRPKSALLSLGQAPHAALSEEKTPLAAAAAPGFSAVTTTADSNFANGRNAPLERSDGGDRSRESSARERGGDSGLSALSSGSAKEKEKRPHGSARRKKDKERQGAAPQGNAAENGDDQVIIHVCDEARKINRDFK